jgi:hypothetical protein
MNIKEILTKERRMSPILGGGFTDAMIQGILFFPRTVTYPLTKRSLGCAIKREDHVVDQYGGGLLTCIPSLSAMAFSAIIMASPLCLAGRPTPDSLAAPIVLQREPKPLQDKETGLVYTESHDSKGRKVIIVNLEEAMKKHLISQIQQKAEAEKTQSTNTLSR